MDIKDILFILVVLLQGTTIILSGIQVAKEHRAQKRILEKARYEYLRKKSNEMQNNCSEESCNSNDKGGNADSGINEF